ncbi:hypothetical protein sS8_0545 [Methylocaldum marinum]|uniref:Uncharacterized protein n=1 Tax=Methylocaldum marinum TaxID=1432792 RepID=A0A250KL71_9GAMM|nr:hypothetical protein [Methylocaldum marinum]BBA32510.1 hypothetical protein sS8_0545 [Methylocaldum marinum]
MSSLNLGFMEKNDVQSFIETLQSADRNEFAGFTMRFARGDEASWKRFIKGAYNHPITWWIGIFQLTMQMGIWGTPLPTSFYSF